MGYEKEADLYLLFHYTGKEDFQKSTPKIQMLIFGLAQTSHFGMWHVQKDYCVSRFDVTPVFSFLTTLILTNMIDV